MNMTDVHGSIMNRSDLRRQRRQRRLHLILFAGLALTLSLSVGASAQNSPHGAIRFECSACHSPDSWSMRGDATFKHEQTGFVLAGQHARVRCTSCHVGLKFRKRSSDCLSCHTDVHKSELGNNCLRCHSLQSWYIPDMIQRHQSTRFPLLGRHSMLACQECHTNAGRKQYAGTPIDCYGCHRDTYAATTSPAHAAAGFPTDCARCHQVTSVQWGGGFSHQLTRFPLTGAHSTLPCLQCHVNNNYQLQFTDCYACHGTDFAKPANPNHALGNFSHACNSCHTTTVWTPSTFSHSTTAFPLVGAHQAVDCNQCHQNNVYSGLPHASCWNCHAGTFSGTVNPNHVAGGFSHDCTTCHSQNSWQPATFNHSATKFPLTGAHATVACAQCHTNGNYTLSYQDCYQCHASDYAGVSNPNHVSQLFPRDCTGCHNTTVWSPNTMNHDVAYFRIYSGKHRGRWSQCSQCHSTPGNFGGFSCTAACHQTAHNQGQNCYGCHRNV
jgi:hypothetical protein